jgi:three-Cys-motif partner protein
VSKQSDFFHSGTEAKLDVIERYLRSYQKVLTKFRSNGGRTVYFDAFAGTGDLPIDVNDGGLLKDVEDLRVIVEGSARRALGVKPPFSKFVFVERSREKAKELAGLKVVYPDRAASMDVIWGDANAELLKFCTATNWRETRAVVFLDPFGNQVDWLTIAEIARCKIDLWYLFPAFLGVSRQISKEGTITSEKAASLDRLFGDSDWRRELLSEETVTELDGTTRKKPIKIATPDVVTRYMISRMASVFKGGVLKEWLPLGRGGSHWYSLLFAWGNKSEAAGRIASDIASHLMTRK